MPLPAILHWNFNHFLVLEGFRKGRVFLNDPATGPREVSEEELDQAFTGVVLTFEPGPEFQRQGRAAAADPGAAPPPRRLAGGARLRPAGRPGAGDPGAGGPGLLQGLRRQRAAGEPAGLATPLLFAMGLAALLTGALTWIQQVYLLRLETRMAVGSSSRFLWHVLRLPVGVLQPALRGRHQLPGGDQRPRGPAPLARPGDQRPRRPDGRLLRRRPLPVRRRADPGGDRRRVAQRGRPALRLPQAGGRQPPARPGPGQAARHGDRRPADDRDAQGDGRRVGPLRALGGLPGQGGQRPAGAGALHPDPRRRPAAALGGQHGADPGPRRPAGDERQPLPRRAGRLPAPDGRVHRARSTAW